MLFLSYAEEDGARAHEIATWFREKKEIPVYYWQDAANRGVEFIDQMEQKLNEADAFIALDSPHFSGSTWCHRETQIALLREEQLKLSQPAARFIRVLKIADSPNRPIRFLDTYDKFDLTDPRALDQQLSMVAASLGQVGSRPSDPSAARQAKLALPRFRNRDDELDRVLHGVTNAAGPHFWLIIAPPQLGKSWFLDQLALRLQAEPTNWSARRVDVADYPDDEVRANVPWLLSRLFGLDPPPVSADEPALRRIANQLLSRGRHHLCVLDSAELLPEKTAVALLAAVDEVSKFVLLGNNRDVRVAFVAGSRRDDEWRRAARRSRLSLLPLSEFKLGVVSEALSDLADQMNRRYSATELRGYAELVYQVSEGLPALLARCLLWIEEEQWIGMDRLERQAEFARLVTDYVDKQLLGPDNLFRTRRTDSTERHVVEMVLRGLLPYRLFMEKHVSDYIQGEPWLAAMLNMPGWSEKRLFGAIRSLALLWRPPEPQPWQEVQAGIRRLLFRYFYTSPDDRAAAHSRARALMQSWTAERTGGDQVTGLLECLWHQAAELRCREAPDAAEVLRESAVALVGALHQSGYSDDEARGFAAQLMRNDEELQDTIAHIPGLFDELVRIVNVQDVS